MVSKPEVEKVGVPPVRHLEIGTVLDPMPGVVLSNILLTRHISCVGRPRSHTARNQGRQFRSAETSRFHRKPDSTIPRTCCLVTNLFKELVITISSSSDHSRYRAFRSYLERASDSLPAYNTKTLLLPG